ncbi:hypothetical protein M408DRAFT_328304 [Serendipita vermifera MAFF 305830]|uniref:C2H2-type domain-containing protein n=1 Tax=Serendipita vermifera MAFF 305830 TaxID=933852 RepID=A0A0C2WVS3_SERVB|nr:hypothetical protein M408DRAFT_328304 [Serendipita vermifera MAFF 305830]
MTHVENRSHICGHCNKGFVRKNELKKHFPCKTLRKKQSSAKRVLNLSPLDVSLDTTGQGTLPTIAEAQPFSPQSEPSSAASTATTFFHQVQDYEDETSGMQPIQTLPFYMNFPTTTAWKTPVAEEEIGIPLYLEPVRAPATY